VIKTTDLEQLRDGTYTPNSADNPGQMGFVGRANTVHQQEYGKDAFSVITTTGDSYRYAHSTSVSGSSYRR
jgi:hypothetical protein